MIKWPLTCVLNRGVEVILKVRGTQLSESYSIPNTRKNQRKMLFKLIPIDDFIIVSSTTSSTWHEIHMAHSISSKQSSTSFLLNWKELYCILEQSIYRHILLLNPSHLQIREQIWRYLCFSSHFVAWMHQGRTFRNSQFRGIH